jgi:kumamolisin
MFQRSFVLACMSLSTLAAFTVRAADADVFALSPAPARAQLSPMADTAPMRVILTLPLSDQAGAESYGEEVSDPQSPRYGQYLTPEEFGARFGANAADYELLRNWAEAAGLKVGPRLASRAEISLGGTARQFAAIFGVHFASFPSDRGGGYTVTNDPVLPALLAGRVDGVIGLTSQARLGLLLRPHVGQADVGHGIEGSGLAPADLVSAYDVVAQTGASSETVAVFEQDGYQASDLAAYATAYGLPSVANQAVSVNGSPTGVAGGAELEADLDIEMLIAMNPKLKNIRVYIDSYEYDTFQTALLDTINQVAQDQNASVLSISYGQDEVMQGRSAQGAESKALIQLQNEGITVLASAGDDGAEGRSGFGLHAADPCTQVRITCVGGTDLFIAANTSAYVGEAVWNDLSTNGGATGGGISSVWKIPNYQLQNGVSVAAANGGSPTYRNVPDVAAVADDENSPVSVYSADNGGWIPVGGTSASAPIWAGWVTIFNGERVAANKARLGLLNPKLYNLGKAGRPFHDITEGNDQGYVAGVGYDNTTGWGSIDVGRALPEFTH